MLVFYHLSIWFYGLVIKVIYPFSEKAKKFIDGRKDWEIKLTKAFERNDHKVVWFHASSLGEFEQGRPVIEELKSKRNDVKILLTFFSPSGYEIHKTYENADWIFYLPLDTPGNARLFIETVKPTQVIFIKYEFWYNFLRHLKKVKIPVLLVSGVFRENQLFFHWAFGRYYQRVLKTFHHLFVQNEKSKKLIEPIVGERVTISGDTRFDRVLTIAKQAQTIEILQKFKNDKKLLVLGSAWPSDMLVLLDMIKKYKSKLKIVIAPHNIAENDIAIIESQLTNTMRFSQASEKVDEADILIVNNMGMLSSIYGYADYAFIGGAFRGALHNTLEAAVYGIPVFFGEHENNMKFVEAIELVKMGGGFTFSTSEELQSKFLELYENSKSYEQMAKTAEEFVKSRSGATDLVMHKIISLLP